MRHGPLHSHPRCCSRCGRRITAIPDLDERCVRDLPQCDHWVDLRVRVVCANRLRSDHEGRQVVKGARWRVLGYRHSLGPAEDV